MGSNKYTLMLKASPNLEVYAVVLEFEKFMKIIVCLTEDVRIAKSQFRNAFDILKQFQVQLFRKEFHHISRKELTKISCIYNNII